MYMHIILDTVFGQVKVIFWGPRFPQKEMDPSFFLAVCFHGILVHVILVHVILVFDSP